MSRARQRIDHDALFKRLLTEFSFDFIQLFFPDVAAQIQPNTLVLLDKELLGKGKRRYRKIVDLALRATLKEGQAFFIIHIEHESSATRLKVIYQRMALYALQLYDLYDLPVYPILLTSFDKPHSKLDNKFVMQAAGHTTLLFNFHVVQLNLLNWRKFMRAKNPIATALMAKMQIAPADRVKVKLECLRLLATLQLDYDRVEQIAQFIDVYLNLNHQQEVEFMAKVEKIPALRKATPIDQIVTSWERRGMRIGKLEGKREGRQEGIQKGLQEGQQMAKAETALRLANRKFGELPLGLQEQINQLGVEQLNVVLDAVLDLTTLDQLTHIVTELYAADKVKV